MSVMTGPSHIRARNATVTTPYGKRQYQDVILSVLDGVLYVDRDLKRSSWAAFNEDQAALAVYGGQWGVSIQ